MVMNIWVPGNEGNVLVIIPDSATSKVRLASTIHLKRSEAIVADHPLPKGTSENHDKSLSGQPVSHPGFNLETSRP